ncbi:hypothetical protein A2164_01590 [Candidatus Curtissbacteria bacterium RBG_13_35_7]|uniref:Type 4 fimbrial biogenesis protein PilX N-terminal domain-containing protein n=1 Tax=Candidatus Curtissbacteria bacterium RBG_13_35_7 TaxID=1797705 RepID=A0A1F5G4H1_9BACT|nr:MAG: hypothetical protein A2164_01590 [Candidatus Curtissbacteria bacterium RBG_13_35_7]
MKRKIATLLYCYIARLTDQKPGQALVTLLVFTSAATIITAAATTITIINMQGSTKFAQGEEVYQIAQAGADNAILRLLRDPSYSGEENLTIGNGTATITITGSSTKTIISEGYIDNFKHKIEVVGTLSNNVLTITSWKSVN